MIPVMNQRVERPQQILWGKRIYDEEKREIWWPEPALKFIYIQLDKNYKLFRIPSRIPIGICLTAFFSFNLTGAGKNNCFQLRRSNPRLRNFSTQKPHSQIFIKKNIYRPWKHPLSRSHLLKPNNDGRFKGAHTKKRERLVSAPNRYLLS